MLSRILSDGTHRPPEVHGWFKVYSCFAMGTYSASVPRYIPGISQHEVVMSPSSDHEVPQSIWVQILRLRGQPGTHAWP